MAVIAINVHEQPAIYQTIHINMKQIHNKYTNMQSLCLNSYIFRDTKKVDLVRKTIVMIKKDNQINLFTRQYPT